ncbi:hypothetical protein ACMD2_03164 [Ananas comosus]|uniref:Uncharacterized protein n=1 Tax=Ananas comosus TaxID=4615 RepID=A0A199VKU9_ANACO|nr:hypothetical protein ACMD2_03164 [Ananas comosus]
MVGESKNYVVQVKKSNRASTSSRRTVECQSQKPWLRSQSQKSEPTPPLSEDPHASTHLPSTVADRPSSPTIANPDTNTTDKERLQNCPDDITKSDWASLVEYFGSEPFKRDSKKKVDPDLTEYWKATYQRRTDNTWCSDKAQNAMV